MKRYVLTTQSYIYAENDEQAIEKAREFCTKSDLQNDNKMSMFNLVFQPQGSMESRLVYGAKVEEFSVK